LDGLGPARQTSNDQRNYLIRIAADFREITAKAVDAYYGRDECFEDDSFCLATNIMAMNNAFSETPAPPPIPSPIANSRLTKADIPLPLSNITAPSVLFVYKVAGKENLLRHSCCPDEKGGMSQSSVHTARSPLPCRPSDT
jgi:hypothetical protein